MAESAAQPIEPATTGEFAVPAGVWVVVPAFNEAQRIGPVLDDLLRVASNVVVVDDGSHDATAAEAAARPVWLLRHAANLGQGAALQTGIAFALEQGAEYLVTFDADGQHAAADIPALLAPLVAGHADFALGSRFLGKAEGIPLLRRFTLRAAVLFTRAFSGIRLTDTHNGLRAMTRRGAQALRITLNGMEHASELIDQIARSGLPHVEVPVTIRYSSDTLAKGQKTGAALKLAAKLVLERISR